MSLTLDQLAVLDAIEARGSFAAAGRDLHRTTSAVSYAVSALESALGIQLFDRSGHRARLTEPGRRVLEEARRVLAQVRRLEQVAGQLEQRWETSLRIVVDGILPQIPIMRALRRLAEARTPTRIELWVEYLFGVQERFENDEADLMLVLDFEGAGAGHVARALPEVPMILLCHREHELSALEQVGRADLAEHVELIVEDSRRGAPPRSPRLSLGSPHIFRLSDFSSKRRALLSKVGFGWMPEHLVTADRASGELVPLKFEEGVHFSFRPHLVQRERGTPGRAASLFVELLEAELRGQ